MATMYDAHMQDFSPDNSMDADMMPSSGPDADWVHTEVMMDDGEFVRPVDHEVEMMHEDVQEYEMTDAGDPEALEYQDMVPEAIESHYGGDIQDQEIPDASRAASPIPHTEHPAMAEMTAHVTKEVHTEAYVAENPVEEHSGDAADVPDSAEQHAETAQHTVVVKATEAPSEVVGIDAHHAEAEVHEHTQEHVPEVEAENAGDTTAEAQVNPHEPSIEAHVEAVHSEHHTVVEGDGHLEAPVHATEDGSVVTEAHIEQHVVEVVQELTEPAEDAETSYESADAHGSEEAHEATEVADDKQPVVTTVIAVESVHDEDDEDEDSLLDPPPCILLSYSFDDSNYALFDLPGDEPAEGSTGPTVLFQDKADLYYEPMSAVFAALRADETINVGGRFDQNVELVISAPDLDLTLPEDNINARDVSLHDLSILHTGCELSGALNLRLDTIAPRFGARYKAIRDEILRVITQEDYSHQGYSTSASEPAAQAPETHDAPAAEDSAATNEQPTEEPQQPATQQASEHTAEEQTHTDGAQADNGHLDESAAQHEEYEGVDATEDADADAEGVYDDAENAEEYTEHEESYNEAYVNAGTPGAEDDAEDYQEDVDASNEEGFAEYNESAYNGELDHDATEVSTQNDPASDGHDDAGVELDAPEAVEGLASEHDQEDDATANATEDGSNLQNDFAQEEADLQETAERLTEFSADATSQPEAILETNDKTHLTRSPAQESTKVNVVPQLRSTASKRSFDEHESDDDDEEPAEQYSSETKRQKLD